jgi:hypothetical protein
LIAFNTACRHPVQNEMLPINRHLIADTVCDYPYFFQGAVFMKNGHIFMVDRYNAGDINIYHTASGQTYHIQAGIMNDIRTGQPRYFSANDSTEYPDAFLQQLPVSFYQSDMDSYYTYMYENRQVKLSRQIFKFRGKRINRVVRINESKYATLGFFHAGLLGLFDQETKLTDYYGHYPVSVVIPSERNAMERIVQSFQGNIACSDQHSKVVYGSSSFAYLSCYLFTGKKLKFQWEKQIVPLPETQIVNGALEYDQTVTRGGFSDVAVAGDYIFASYTQIDFKDSIPEITRGILVYDMTGKHLATYHTDSSITNMVIDLDEGFLYGVSREVAWEPVIVRFQIDQI